MAGYVNAPIPFPEAPGPWVDETSCDCGDHRADYRSTHYRGINFGAAAQRLREANQAAELRGDLGTVHNRNDPPGGYRSRGAVLHMMSVMKMERWFDDHASCDTCEIAHKWPEWWEEQESAARDEGFDGEWEWCDDDDDDDGDDDDDDDDYLF